MIKKDTPIYLINFRVIVFFTISYLLIFRLDSCMDIILGWLIEIQVFFFFFGFWSYSNGLTEIQISINGRRNFTTHNNWLIKFKFAKHYKLTWQIKKFIAIKSLKKKQHWSRYCHWSLWILPKQQREENVLGGGATATAAEKGQYKLRCGFNKNDLGLHLFWTLRWEIERSRELGGAILFIYSSPLDPFGQVNIVLVFETETKLNIF